MTEGYVIPGETEMFMYTPFHYHNFQVQLVNVEC